MYISNGNLKVKCPIWSLPAVKTCKKGLSCHKYCYARKAEKQYKAVLPCRNKNFKASKDYYFTNRMFDKIRKLKCKYFRIHESGDFYSRDYINKWYAIARMFPDIRFYAYTKRDDLFTPDVLDNKPSNLTLIYSLDAIQSGNKFDVPKGFDKLAVVHDSKVNCPAQVNKDIKCMTDCTKCASKGCKVIYFAKH